MAFSLASDTALSVSANANLILSIRVAFPPASETPSIIRPISDRSLMVTESLLETVYPFNDC